MSAHDVARTRRESQPSIPKARSLSFTGSPVDRVRQALGASERLFVGLHRVSATNLIRVIAIEGVLSPNDLKVALHLLAARHPMMRARIADGPKPCLIHGDAPTLRVRTVHRRDDEHYREELERLLNRPLAHDAGPLFELHYLYAPNAKRAEIIVVGEHAVCDGVSMNNLCVELLELCARKDLRVTRPTLPVLDTLLPRFSPRERARPFSRVLAKFARVTAQRRLFEPRKAAAASSYTAFTLSPTETSALFVNARRAATTVTGALMAATLLALRERHPRTPRLSLSIPVNLRPRLPQHDLAPEDLANFTSPVYLESTARGELWQLARSLRADLDREVHESLLPIAQLAYTMGRLLIRKGRPPLTHAMVSNSGVVNLARSYGAFRPVGFFSATSAPMISADLCFFCNTLHDQLTVNVVFVPEIIAREDAQRIMERVRALLLQR